MYGISSSRLTTIQLQNLSAWRNAGRLLHTSPASRTDGVFKELTAMRVQTPFVEALRTRKEGIDSPAQKREQSAQQIGQDLNPKRMSDSYHKVVCQQKDGRARI